jgi:glycosyltransferase involved in cell wall biosynthesis
MTRDLQIILVSPSAHYPSHNWPNTMALMRALRRKGLAPRAVIYSDTPDPIPPDLRDSVVAVFPPPTSGGSQNKTPGRWQGRRFGKLKTSIETIYCLFKALKLSRDQTRPVFHFIGGSYWAVVLGTLIFRRAHFVCSLYGGILYGPRSGPRAWIRFSLKRLLRRAAATGRLDFTCENDFLLREIQPVLGEHIHVVPYAIDEAETLPAQDEARRLLNLPSEEKILLFFGTHRREKDYVTALKGAGMLSKPPLALFVGKVISSNDPRQVVAECKYPNHRIADKFVPEEMTQYYFAAADAVVLPYEADFSRGSGVLIECCRFLRPMIASATPYFSAFLAHYQCGVSYVPGDSASFADAAGRLLADGTSYREALTLARRDHSWLKAADQYIKLYSDSV